MWKIYNYFKILEKSALKLWVTRSFDNMTYSMAKNDLSAHSKKNKIGKSEISSLGGSKHYTTHFKDECVDLRRTDNDGDVRNECIYLYIF